MLESVCHLFSGQGRNGEHGEKQGKQGLGSGLNIWSSKIDQKRREG